MDKLFLTDEHIMIRDMVRKFADSEISPVAQEFDEKGKFPRELVEKMGEMRNPFSAEVQERKR